MQYRSILIGLVLPYACGAHAAAPVIVLTGKGVQIYGCAETTGTYGWTLKGPKAVLFDTAGKPIGTTLPARPGRLTMAAAWSTKRSPRLDQHDRMPFLG